MVVPVRNGEPYLAETLSSIARQSYGDWECWIMDGGSSDATVAIARRFQQVNRRFHVETGHDRGMYDALFKGLARCSGTLLTWINADDLFMPGAFAAAAREMNAPGRRWICGLPAIADASGDIRYVDPSNWYPRRAIAAGLFHGRWLGWIQQEGIFFHRSLLDQVPPATVEAIRGSRLCGDFLLWVALAQHERLSGLPLVLAAFRKHGGNASLNAYEGYFEELGRHGFHPPLRPFARVARYTHQIASTLVTKHSVRRHHTFERGQ